MESDSAALDAATSGADWWKHGLIYHVYPRSFADGNGDGVGDLIGLRTRLGYLRELGVDVVWLSPFYRSPMHDFGYDVADHQDVDPLFGDLAAFDAVVRECDRLGLKIVIDYVPNHTAAEHPWFVRSRSARSDPLREWYVWRDPAAGGGPPNNWLSVFGGPAWTLDERTGQYYLHSFLPSMPDLDWRNPAVREAMFEVCAFWLRRGVHGFRIDCAHFLAKDPLLRDNPPAVAGHTMHKPMGGYDAQEHLYDKGHPDVHQIYRDLRKVLDSPEWPGERIAIGEVHIFDWAEWAAYYGAGLDELTMPINFGLLAVPWTAEAVGRLISEVGAALPVGAWPNWVLGNHDESRIATRLGAHRARAAMLLLLTLRGTPTLYYGDELGLPDAVVPADRARDPWGLRVEGLSRDPSRAPMPWNHVPSAGFCPDGVEPWLPFAADPREFSVQAQNRQDDSMLSFTKRLLALRRAKPALHRGEQTVLDAYGQDVLLLSRRHGAEEVIVAISFSEVGGTVDLAKAGCEYPRAWSALLSTSAGAATVDEGMLTLAGNSGVILGAA